MAKKKRNAAGRFLPRKKNEPGPAKVRTRRRRRNPVQTVSVRRRRRRHNPAALSKSAVLGYGTGLLTGAVLGAASAGLDAVLDPKLCANPLQRGGIDAGIAAVAVGVGAAVGMPAVATGASGALGFGLAQRLIGGYALSPQIRKDRAQAIIDRAIADATAKGATLNPGMPAIRRAPAVQPALFSAGRPQLAAAPMASGAVPWGQKKHVGVWG